MSLPTIIVGSLPAFSAPTAIRPPPSSNSPANTQAAHKSANHFPFRFFIFLIGVISRLIMIYDVIAIDCTLAMSKTVFAPSRHGKAEKTHCPPQAMRLPQNLQLAATSGSPITLLLRQSTDFPMIQFTDYKKHIRYYIHRISEFQDGESIIRTGVDNLQNILRL